MPADCAVAFADRSRLELERWDSLLSAREKAETSTYTRQDRRWKTIASRLLTKYLVADHGVQRFRRVDAREIEAADGALLASIENLSGVARERTTPSIVRGGHRCSGVSASSSHCGIYTASCIGGSRIGLDLERIQPRRREFYKYTFSYEERDWVQRIGVNSAGVAEAGFTMLWSVKEAFLKASGRPDLTVWSFPRWTVSVADRMRQVLQSNARGGLVTVPGGIRGPGFSRVFELSAMRVNDMILAIVQY
jgi:phosphopantetheinyl transferase